LTVFSNVVIMWCCTLLRKNRIMEIQILCGLNGILFSKIAAMHLKYEHALISFLLLCGLYFPFEVLQVLTVEDLTNKQCLFFVVCLVSSQLLMTRTDGAVSHLPGIIRAVTTRNQMKPLNCICFPDHGSMAYGICFDLYKLQSLVRTLFYNHKCKLCA